MAKGRDKELVNTRNIRIYERYYFWTEVKRLRFDDALRRLSTEEFFLSESRIMQIIRDMIQAGVTVDGKELAYNKDNAAGLYERFPWIKEQVDTAVGERANFIKA